MPSPRFPLNLRASLAACQAACLAVCLPACLPVFLPAFLVLLAGGIAPANAQGVAQITAQGTAQVTAQGTSTDEQMRLVAALRQTILDNPEIIRDALMKLHQREEADKQARATDAIRQAQPQLVGDRQSPVVGNPAGSVTVVQFYDYNCGHCRKAAPAIAELLRTDPDVRVVFKEFPILGEASLYAARAALAAQRQGQFPAFHDELMKTTPLDQTGIAALAKRLKLDHARLLKDMDNPEVRAALERNHALASQLGINGTPAFIIGDRLVPGAMDATQMSALVTLERANQRKR